MKKLLAVVVVLGLGAVVYAKVIRSSPETRTCERINSLCGKTVEVGECRAKLDEAEKILGEKVIDKATDCIEDANTCMEAVGCMAGAGTHALDDFEKGFERSKR